MLQMLEAGFGLRRWFFIRYFERGPHVRLRLGVGEGVASSEIVRAVEEFLVTGYDQGWTVCDESGGAQKDRLARWQVYERELQRYGGIGAIADAEAHFQTSSECALTAIEGALLGRGGMRATTALVSGAILLFELGADARELGQFGAQYGQAWLRSIASSIADADRLWKEWSEAVEYDRVKLERLGRQLVERLESGRTIDGVMDRWRDGVRQVRARLTNSLDSGALRAPDGSIDTWERARRFLQPSFLHMHNNRLGIDPLEECRLGLASSVAFRQCE